MPCCRTVWNGKLYIVASSLQRFHFGLVKLYFTSHDPRACRSRGESRNVNPRVCLSDAHRKSHVTPRTYWSLGTRLLIYRKRQPASAVLLY